MCTHFIVMPNAAPSAEAAAAAAPPSSLTQQHRRMERTTVCLPIVHGSVAFSLGKKADEFQTHQWTLYVRGPNHEDLSLVISKVVFHLHASFSQPVRELTSPPYEVSEKGWGEFEAQIRIVWKDPNEKSVLVRW
jgi:YEATS domain-containing protein 4